MTGFEKFAIAGVLSATGAQITIGSAGTLFSIAWAVLGAVLATGVMYGTIRARLRGVEEKTAALTETCATIESVEALEKQLALIVRMLESRIADRRHDA